MGFGAIEAEDFCEQELSQFIEQQLLAGTAGECGYGGELGMYNKGGARELGPRELGVREPPNGRGELLSTSREFIPQQPRTEYIDQRDICRQGLAPTRLSDSSEIPRIRPPRDLQRDTGAAPAELREAVDEALELLRLMTLNDRSPKSADSTADTTEYVPPTDYVPAPF